jgi:hypothetical protein
MPTPTILIPFGESSDNSNIFGLVSLDSQANVDSYGNELTSFLDTELVYILVHLETGASVESISTSWGSIINADSPKLVNRTHEIEEVVFKDNITEITLPHYPSSGLTISWKGRSRTLNRNGRKITCSGGAGICSISYTFQAWQYILEVPDLALSQGENFPVEISYKVVKGD